MLDCVLVTTYHSGIMSTPFHQHGPRSGTGFPVDRRGFLKTSALSAAALSLGSGALMGGCSDAYAGKLPGRLTLFVLSPKEYVVAAAFASRIVGDEPGRSLSEATQPARRLDRELRFHHRQLVDDVKSALLLVEHGGLAHGGFTRFSQLDENGQDARLTQMRDSRHEVERIAFSALRLMSIFFHYAHEATWPSIGYQGPLVAIANPPPADNRRD